MNASRFLKLAVIGDPIAHSKSPELHRRFLREAHLQGTYEAVRVVKETVQDELARFVRERYLGLNVTTPLKEAVLAYAGIIETKAQIAGAANTLTYDRSKGTWIATNTDGEGARIAMEQAFDGALLGKRLLVLGAGATGRAASFAFTQAGATVWIWSRSLDKSRLFVDACGAHVWLNQAIKFDGVFSSLPPAVSIPHQIVATLNRTPVIYDANYSVRATLGATLSKAVITGESMLEGQARASFRIWCEAIAKQ